MTTLQNTSPMEKDNYACPIHWCSTCRVNPPDPGDDRIEGEHLTMVLEGQGFGSVGVIMRVEITDAGYVFHPATVYQDMPHDDSIVAIDGQIIGEAFKLASLMATAINDGKWGDVDDAERYLAELESEGR